MRPALSTFIFLCFCILVFGSFSSLLAQNTSPYWSLAGNSNATTASKLGTTKSVPLRLFTKNLERIRIDTFGRVGIGTIVPQRLLHVYGSLSTILVERSNNPKGFADLEFKPQGTLSSTNARWGTGLYSNSPNYQIWSNIGATDQLRFTITPYGNVGIGTTNPVYTLDVNGVVRFSNFVKIDYGGLYSYCTSCTGVYGSGYYGIDGEGDAYGVYAYGGTSGVYGTGPTYGLRGASSGNVAVVGQSSTSRGGDFYSDYNYGLVASTGDRVNSYAAVFNGSIYCFGTYQPSDYNLKKNIQSLDKAMAILNQLKPKSYEYKNDGRFASYQLPPGTHYGLIAQELEIVLPGLVKVIDPPSIPVMDDKTPPTKTMSNGQKEPVKIHVDTAWNRDKMPTKAVNYTELIPIMIKAMQEQQQQMDKQQQQIDLQQQQIQELKDLVIKLSNGQNISGVSPDNMILEQNTPNPFEHSTSIHYSIPSGFGSAQLLITNAEGKTIKTINLTSGSGVVNLDGSLLSSGSYNYTLIVDGKKVQSKKMALVK